MDRFDEMRNKGINTNDATATSLDIVQGKTAYAQGRRIIGELVPSSGNPGVISDIYSWCAQKGAVIPEEQTVENLLECVKSISEITMVTVNFDTVGGETIEPQTIVYGHAITAVTPTHPNNYTFSGWLLAGEPFNSNDPITGNCTLVASWNEVPSEVYLMSAGTSSNQVKRAYGAYQRLGNTASSAYTRDKILSITFLADPQGIKSGYLASWDVSLNIDGSAMAYIYSNTNKSGYYDLYIAGATKLILPANLTYFFKGYTSCTSINGLHLFDTNNATSMSGMFQDCDYLTDINISNFDTSKVTDMTFMFSGCNALTNVDFGNCDLSNVTNIGNMFTYCENLLSFDGSGFNSANSVGAMFSSCKKIKNINLCNLDTSGATYFNQMFYYCQSLETLDIRKMTFNGSTSNYQTFTWIPDTCVIYVKSTVEKEYIEALDFKGTIKVVN